MAIEDDVLVLTDADSVVTNGKQKVNIAVWSLTQLQAVFGADRFVRAAAA